MAKTNKTEEVNETVDYTAMNVYERLLLANAFIDKCEFVKTLTNTEFSSVPIDKMRNSVRNALCKSGLVKLRTDVDYDRTLETTKSGGQRIRMVGTATYRFVNVNCPSDFVEYTTMGESTDSLSDKCTSKFLANLDKNLYKSVFDIGDNKDDIDSYADEPVVIPKVKKVVKEDPFFGKLAPKETPKTPVETKDVTPNESPKDVPLEEKKFSVKEFVEFAQGVTEPTIEVTADRPRAVMLETIRKLATENEMVGNLAFEYCNQFNKYNDEDWTDEEVKLAYTSVVKAMRMVE